MNARILRIVWDRLKSWMRALNRALSVPPPLEGDGISPYHEDTVFQPRDF